MEDRITVALDQEAKRTLENLEKRGEESKSELVRNAISFYGSNYRAAEEGPKEGLSQYYELVDSGEYVILDVDFLYLFLKYLYREGEHRREFLEAADQVFRYQALAYSKRFDDVEELVDWLALCGLLTAREGDDGAFHLLFPSDEIRRFTTRFIEQTCSQLDADVEIESAVSKALIVRTDRQAKGVG